jgi:peptidoglycan/xylan/chitin deacetylase (PgdA/CDA1 family)
MNRTRTNWGRILFAILWVAGLGSLAAMATGLLPAPPLAVAGIILGLCITIAIGCISQSCGFFARPIYRVTGVTGRLSITFDDGPDEEFTPQILDLLARHGQHATFFVVGDKVRRHPELARRIAAEGHELGNHTASHPWHIALWTPRRVAEELMRANQQIADVTGVTPRLFRSPAAVLSPRVARGARRAGLELVGYTIRSGDGSPVIPSSAALMVLRWGLEDGAILTLHDAAVSGRPPVSLTVLPRLFEEMERRNLISVTVSELLRLSESQGQPDSSADGVTDGSGST